MAKARDFSIPDQFHRRPPPGANNRQPPAPASLLSQPQPPLVPISSTAWAWLQPAHFQDDPSFKIESGFFVSFMGSSVLSLFERFEQERIHPGKEEILNLLYCIRISIDWDNLCFGLIHTDYMYTMKCSQGETFSKGELKRFGNIELSPSAGVLNYGQGLFEGMKAYRKHDGNILLFRLEENAARLREGAVRMCMPAPTIEQFVEAVKATVLANERWKEGLAPINLVVETEMHRATPGGTGEVKTIGNYAAVLQAQSVAKAKGFSDVLYLDSFHKKYLEEVSSCNVFIVKFTGKNIARRILMM